MLFTGLGRSVLGETVPEFLSTARGLLRFKSLRKILLISLQPMCVEEGRVRVDVWDFKIQRRDGNENVA